MRLEFLPEKPLIRLFDFLPAEADRLKCGITELATERVERIAVHELPGITAVGGCQLVLCLRTRDQAVHQASPMLFECGFTAGTWDNVAGLIEPFAEGCGGFQWLAGVPGEASLLLSISGDW